MNTTSQDEHVGDVERYIRTIKECMRGISNTIPFKRLTHNMVMELAKAVVYWLNSVPSNMEVSPTMSPRAIITGQLLDYHKHCQYEFGEYVQTHEEHDNSLLSHTIGAIASQPTGNQQGGYFFMSLHTGRIINRLHATKLPMPAEVITRVEQLAKAQDMIPSLAFGNRDNRLIMQDITDDEETENVYIPNDEADSTLYYDTEASLVHVEDIDKSANIEEINNVPHSDTPTNMIRLNDSVTVSTVTDDMTTPTGTENDQMTPLPDIAEEENQDDTVQNLDHNIESTINTTHDKNNHNDKLQDIAQALVDDIVDITLDDEMNEKYGSRTTKWNLRQRKQRTYDHKYDENAEIYVTQVSEATLATPQMPIRCGLKLFRSAGISAVKAELQQLHDLKVMEAKPLTTTQK